MRIPKGGTSFLPLPKGEPKASTYKYRDMEIEENIYIFEETRR